MRVKPTHTLLLDDQQAYLRQETDTAHPRPPIPIFYLHDLPTPFCTNRLCFCKRGRRAVTRLFGEIAGGRVLLAELAAVAEGTDQPAAHRVHITLVDGIPQSCQLYGHSWEATAQAGVKVCSLCGIKGYCPGCTSQAPAGAQPFYCTKHTPPESGVQS